MKFSAFKAACVLICSLSLVSHLEAGLAFADGNANVPPNRIRFVETDGTGLQDLVPSLTGGPRQLAVDNLARHIYWAETLGNSGSIRRVDLDGSNIVDVVAGLDASFGVTLDLPSNKIYWADRDTRKIQRANFDDSEIEDVVSGLTQPRMLLSTVSVKPSTGRREAVAV